MHNFVSDDSIPVLYKRSNFPASPVSFSAISLDWFFRRVRTVAITITEIAMTQTIIATKIVDESIKPNDHVLLDYENNQIVIKKI